MSALHRQAPRVAYLDADEGRQIILFPLPRRRWGGWQTRIDRSGRAHGVIRLPNDRGGWCPQLVCATARGGVAYVPAGPGTLRCKQCVRTLWQLYPRLAEALLHYDDEPKPPPRGA